MIQNNLDSRDKLGFYQCFVYVGIVGKSIKYLDEYELPSPKLE